MACVLAALGAVMVLDVLGVVAALDASARRGYYAIRGVREGPPRVVFVALDETTTTAWGAPPWRWERYEALIEAIRAGEPRLVAVLEPGPRVARARPSAGLARAIDAGEVLLAPALPGYGQPRLALDARGAVEAVVLHSADDPTGSITAAAIASIGGDAGRARLPVNYLGPAERFPTVPGHRVADGEIPASTFTGRIVVIGLRGARFAPQVPTPVGPMSPAEVHAHALAGVADGVAWVSVPSWVRWPVLALLALIAIAVVPRAHGRGLAILVGGAGLTVAFVDYALFATGVARAGLAAPLFAMGVAGAGAALVERNRADRALVALARGVARRMSIDAQERVATGSTDAFFERFARATRNYLGLHSAIVGELAEGAWHLELRVLCGVTAGDIEERRRDIRREPYKSAYLAREPGWSARPMMREPLGVRTLMVPLVAFQRLLGFWLVNVERERELSRAELQLITQLADQLSLAIERRRLQRLARLTGPGAGWLSRSRLLTHIAEARQSVLSLSQAERELEALVETLPVGVLVATLWGEIELANDSMRRFLRAAGVEELAGVTLADVLARLTGTDATAVHGAMRELLGGRARVRLQAEAPASVGHGTRYEMVLARALRQRGPDLGDAGGDAPAHLVLTVTEIAGEPLADARWRWHTELDGEHGARAIVDIAAIATELARGLEAAGQAVVCELPARAVRMLGRPGLVREALEAVAQALGEGAAAPLVLRVREDAGEVELVMADETTTLPAADVARIRAGVDASPGTPAAALVRARRLIEAAGGRMHIDSDIETGTAVTVVLTADAPPPAEPAVTSLAARDVDDES